MSAHSSTANNTTYHVVGLMSGTSLDGLDIALCKLTYSKGKWRYSILKAQTYKYDKEWNKKLRSAHFLSSIDLLELHTAYGTYIGNCINRFIKGQNIRQIDLVASHGHTVFHQPAKHTTFQLGHGAAIASTCRIPVVSDFRIQDMLLGGQGAPLIPVCDLLLFSEYDFCLNLGGFANISFCGKNRSRRLAFDICPANIAINYFAQLKGKEYDAEGTIAATGTVRIPLLAKLNSLAYYSQSLPKSLGREWLEESFLPIVNEYRISINDKLATITEHVAEQIAKAINDRSISLSKKSISNGRANALITGGGAFNTFLVDKIREKTVVSLTVPDNTLVNFKEALGFALLGVLRMRGEINCLKSVTGANRDSSGGAIYSGNGTGLPPGI